MKIDILVICLPAFQPQPKLFLAMGGGDAIPPFYLFCLIYYPFILHLSKSQVMETGCKKKYIKVHLNTFQFYIFKGYMRKSLCSFSLKFIN